MTTVYLQRCNSLWPVCHAKYFTVLVVAYVVLYKYGLVYSVHLQLLTHYLQAQYTRPVVWSRENAGVHVHHSPNNIRTRVMVMQDI